MQRKSHLKPEDQGILSVSRHKTGWRDVFREYKVVVDGIVVAGIHRGETYQQALEPGQHELRIKIDWSGSQAEVFQLNPGERIEFICEPNGNILNVLWQIFTPSSWVRLTRVR
jgi:hypothetical protein